VTSFTAIGHAAVVSGIGDILAELKAEVGYAEESMLYYFIKTTAVNGKGVAPSYSVDGEQSWVVLKEIEGSWPGYIPKVDETYIVKKTVEIEDLYNYATGYNATTRNSSVA
jgi:hypothetical protein